MDAVRDASASAHKSPAVGTLAAGVARMQRFLRDLRENPYGVNAIAEIRRP